MRVKLNMIDKELPWAAVLGRCIMHPWPWFIRILATMSKRVRVRSIEGLRCEEIWIPGSGGNSRIRVCVYKPLICNEFMPALLYFHPGGYILGTPKTSWPIIRSFIGTRHCV